MQGMVNEIRLDTRKSFKVELNGSARQGSISSSLFNPSCRENGDKICKEIDLDFQLSFKVNLDKLSCLKNVEGKLGLISIRSHCIKSAAYEKLKYNFTGKDFVQDFHLNETILKN